MSTAGIVITIFLALGGIFVISALVAVIIKAEKDAKILEERMKQEYANGTDESDWW